MEMYHDGGNSGIGYINYRGSNKMILSGNNISFFNKSRSEEMLKAIENNGVFLFYDNVQKFQTTSTGISVTGDGVFSGNVSIAGTLTYEDVTNLDSIGIATARTGLDVTSGGIDVTGLSTFRDYLRVNADNSDSRLYVGSGPSSNQLELRHINGSSYLYHYGTHTFHIALAVVVQTKYNLILSVRRCVKCIEMDQ